MRVNLGFPSGSAVKNPLGTQEKQASSVPGLGRRPGGGNGNPLQDSCLESSTDRAWPAAGHWVTKSQTGLSLHIIHHSSETGESE